MAVVAAGIIEGEGYDRSHLELPGSQEQLIKAVAATGTPTVVVLYNGSAVTMINWVDELRRFSKHGTPERKAAMPSPMFSLVPSRRAGSCPDVPAVCRTGAPLL